jgi:hypothetical protein
VKRKPRVTEAEIVAIMVESDKGREASRAV